MLYYDRLYTIYQAVSNLKPPAAGMALDLAEVGVYKGGTSHFILAALESLGLRPATLHCFDTFEGHSSGDVRYVFFHFLIGQCILIKRASNRRCSNASHAES